MVFLDSNSEEKMDILKSAHGKGAPLVLILFFTLTGAVAAGWAEAPHVQPGSSAAKPARCFLLTLLDYAVNYILKYPYTFPLRGSYKQAFR